MPVTAWLMRGRGSGPYHVECAHPEAVTWKENHLLVHCVQTAALGGHCRGYVYGFWLDLSFIEDVREAMAKRRPESDPGSEMRFRCKPCTGSDQAAVAPEAYAVLLAYDRENEMLHARCPQCRSAVLVDIKLGERRDSA